MASFVELVRFIFDIPGVEAFLSEKLCQDSLEQFFSMQRQRGRTNENPNVHEFLSNTQQIAVVRSICQGTIKGNCRVSTKRPLDMEKENKPLPRRKYAREQ